jgi:gas vesicle protein
MGEDPREIERQIEHTREHMGDTVEALAYKADVPSRVKESLTDKKDAVVDKLSEAKHAITGSAGDTASRTGDVAGQAGQTAKRAVGMAQQNPLGMAVGGIAAGFVIGSLLPATRTEEERLGPVASQAREQVSDLASDALDRGKQVAQEAAQAATDTVKDSSAEHAQQLTDEAKQAATETVNQARS